MADFLQSFDTQLAQFNQFANEQFPLSSLVTPVSSQSPSSIGDKIGSAVGSAIPPIGVMQAVSNPSTWIRIAAGLVGLIMIAGAIYLMGVNVPGASYVKQSVKGALLA